MHASQVLDMQADLLRRLNNDGYQKYARHVMASDETASRWMLQVLTGGIRSAYAYRVTHDMSMLVQHVASTLDASDRFRRDMAPTQSGLVRFDRPLPIIDARGRTMLGHWVAWAPCSYNVTDAFGREKSQPSLLTTWWNDTAEPDEVQQEIDREHDGDEAYRRSRSMVGRFSIIGASLTDDGRAVGGHTVPLLPKEAERIASEGDTPQPYTNPHRYLHALFFLLNQTITTSNEEAVRKTSSRMARHMGIPARVVTIALRRHEGSRHEGETDVQWAHRWVVRGHPAWRRCGADHPYAEPYEKGWRVRVWIAPYLKGPDDKPLVQSEKVYELRR